MNIKPRDFEIKARESDNRLDFLSSNKSELKTNGIY